MKLVVGKTYIQRGGQEVKIVKKIQSPHFHLPFVGDDDELYREDGTYMYKKHQRDLVDEKVI